MIWMLASLMMTQVEEQQVAPLIEPAHEHQENQAATVLTTLNDDIRISAIIYTASDQWVVWMGGHKLRPQNLDGDGFQLQKVEPTSVTLTLENHPGKTFHLSPGECLARSTGQIVD